jgi:hypothetical protein
MGGLKGWMDEKAALRVDYTNKKSGSVIETVQFYIRVGHIT